MSRFLRAYLLSLLLAFAPAAAFGATSVSVNDGGTWRQASEIHVKDGGTWRLIEEVWVKDSATWRMVYQRLVIDLSFLDSSNFSEVDSPAMVGTVTSQLVVYSAGSVGYTGTISTGSELLLGNWRVGGAAADFQVRTTCTGDAPTGGSATATWLALSSDRSWSWTQAGNGSQSAGCTTEIRRVSDSVVVASANWSTYVEVTFA